MKVRWFGMLQQPLAAPPAGDSAATHPVQDPTTLQPPHHAPRKLLELHETGPSRLSVLFSTIFHAGSGESTFHLALRGFMLRISGHTRYIARNTRSSSLSRAFSRQHRPPTDSPSRIRARSSAPICRTGPTIKREKPAISDSNMEERAYAQADRGRKGRGKGGRGGGGMSREVQVSKALSRLLRHQAESAGIKLDEAGFAELDKVVSLIMPPGLVW